jgi:integrase
LGNVEMAVNGSSNSHAIVGLHDPLPALATSAQAAWMNGKPLERKQKPRSRGNGRGSIYRRNKGWVGALPVGRDDDGKLIRRKTLVMPTKKAAEEALDELRRQLGIGITADETVGSYLPRWLATAVPLRTVGDDGPIDTATISHYGYMVKLLTDYLGGIRLMDLTHEDVETMMRSMAERTVNKKGEPAAPLSRDTIKRARTVLRLALDRAIRDRRVVTNVAVTTDLPQTTARPSRKSMTPEQAATFLDSIAAYRYRNAWAVQIQVGLRPGEILGLLWDNVDLGAGLLHVRHTLKDSVDGKPVLGPTKGGKARTITITPPLVAVFRDQQDRQADERDQAGELWNENGLVFPTSSGTPTDHREYRKSLQRATKAAGIGEDWTPHELRHTCASLLIDQNVPDYVVADLLGHADLRMIRTYRHPVRDAVSVPTLAVG